MGTRCRRLGGQRIWCQNRRRSIRGREGRRGCLVGRVRGGSSWFGLVGFLVVAGMMNS